ncbi:MAG: tetratricopeptide repeat protein, partial [Akkermansiaceae bacterium]|nr:tetratricopeptide repeat protein [Akkermansiaceae bacterium]
MVRVLCVVASLVASSVCALPPGEIRPTRLAAEHREAAALLAKGDWERAAEAYRAMVARDPGDSLARQARLGVAQAMAAAGKHDEALVELRTLLAVTGERAAGAVPGRQQLEGGWLHAVHGAIGRLLEQQGKLEEAAAAYREAGEVIAGDETLAAWRARAAMDLARCLARRGKPAQAISLLTGGLAELAAPELAGMRALQMAKLGRYYFEIGERDWAVTLLERIRRDPQLDQQQYGAAEALVEGKRWKPAITGKMRTRKGPGHLAIESTNCFELRLALAAMEGDRNGIERGGRVTGWFNLEDDPFKTTNLAGAGPFGLFGLGWGDLPPTGREDGVFEVLEENEVRVRTRTRRFDRPFEMVDCTFYPAGQVVVAASLEPEAAQPARRIRKVSFHTATNARLNWRDAGAGKSRMSGEGPAVDETPFVLAHSNSTPSFQRFTADDILTVPAWAHSGRAVINDERPLRWRRSSMRIAPVARGPARSLAVQLRVYPRTLDSPALAEPYADDYQQPARLEVRRGSVMKDDPGDLDGDGFNEGEGCYVVRGTEAVTLVAGEFTRHQP